MVNKPIFVIQLHNATHLHYDFRLEMDGVLKSWAVPKQPPKILNIKRLAIQVEDHPLSYATFEGIIPDGNYGAGTVQIWDKGTYELISRSGKEITVTLHGKELKGVYSLIKMQKENHWLLLKKKDVL